MNEHGDLVVVVVLLLLLLVMLLLFFLSVGSLIRSLERRKSPVSLPVDWHGSLGFNNF